MAVVTHPTPTAELLRTASQRLVRTVDSLGDDAWALPSLLPGWSAAHVAAHLALNGEALAGVLVGVAEGEPVPMYASQEARDRDIDELAAEPPQEIRSRLMGAVTRLEAAITALPEELAGTVVHRTPGSEQTFPAGAVPSMRLREVEIHHADLGPVPGLEDYSPADWPDEFTALLLDHAAKRWHGAAGFTAAATDLGRTWTFGTPGPTVSGPGHVLAWWATGRPAYPGTRPPVSDDGDLPAIEAM